MGEQRGKIFGVGLPRTGTTSVSWAMLDFGYKTGHCCFSDSLLEKGDAFFDTPIYVDYPLLDQSYPGSKFILTWRDPDKWLQSFKKNLLNYFHKLPSAEYRQGGISRVINWRCYTAVFGTPDTLTDDILLKRYHEHRQRVEGYFRQRPQDLLIMEIDINPDPWEALCPFLGQPRPDHPFPFLNTASQLYQWMELIHPNKVPSWPEKNPLSSDGKY